MILPKEVAEIRRGPSHCLETNHVVYGISDVVRQIVYNSLVSFADYPCEPTLLVGYKLFIVLSFPIKFSKRYIL